MRRPDLVGKVFGRLTVVGYVGVKNQKSHWRCRCVCGGVVDAVHNSLTNGHTQSCGCLRKDWPTTHGLSASPAYRVWVGMIERCTNPGHKSYAEYGGRGIRVCEAWLASVETFAADMGPKPRGTQIDRIDNNGHYEPGNCRWATPQVNYRNKRNNLLLTHDGRTQTLAAWAEATGLGRVTIRCRLKAGWSVSDALTLPPRPAGRGQSRRHPGRNKPEV